MAVYTHTYTATHMYTQTVALIKVRYFICYGVGQVDTNLPFPKPYSFKYKQNAKEEYGFSSSYKHWEIQTVFSRGCKFSINPGGILMLSFTLWDDSVWITFHYILSQEFFHFSVHQFLAFGTHLECFQTTYSPSFVSEI